MKYGKAENIKEGAYIGWEIIKTVVGIGILVIFFRFFIIQPFSVSGNSMNPDFQNGEYLFVDEASYYFRSPERGEVIVFKHPDTQPSTNCTAFVENNKFLTKFIQGPCLSFIKRVIAVPGDTVIVKNGYITIKNTEHPEGLKLNETYVEDGVKTLGDQTVTLHNNEYYVVGDNRQPGMSYDSRGWGVLKREFIIGRAWLRLLPSDSVGFIPRAEY